LGLCEIGRFSPKLSPCRNLQIIGRIVDANDESAKAVRSASRRSAGSISSSSMFAVSSIMAMAATSVGQ
jgi:hypothetical protein